MSKENLRFSNYAFLFIGVTSIFLIYLNTITIERLPKDEAWKAKIILGANFFCFAALDVSMRATLGWSFSTIGKIVIKNNLKTMERILSWVFSAAMTVSDCSEKFTIALLSHAQNELQKFPKISFDRLKKYKNTFYKGYLEDSIFRKRDHKHEDLLDNPDAFRR